MTSTSAQAVQDPPPKEGEGSEDAVVASQKASAVGNDEEIQEKEAMKDSANPEVKKGKRPMCMRCSRPAKVCICESLPESPIALKRCHILVLQHPHEAKRQKGRSLPLIQLCLDPNDITVVVSRRFGDQVNSAVLKLMEESSKILLVFPTQDDQACAEHESNQNALTLSEAREFCQTSQDNNQQPKDKTNEEESNGDDKILIIMLDATWKYAKEMDKANILGGAYPKHMKRLALSWEDPLRPAQAEVPCRFDIRTPPSEVHLSTAECIAWILSALEEEESTDDPSNNNNIYSTLMKPLDCMVAKWHECRQNATENHQPRRRNKKKKKGGEKEEEKKPESRDYSYYGNPEHHHVKVKDPDDDYSPTISRASFFTMGDNKNSESGGKPKSNSRKRGRNNYRN